MSGGFSTPDEYIASFPHSTIPPIQGRPNYAALRELRSMLKTNAASVRSTLGGGANGYLGLIVAANIYNTIAPGTPFNIPQFPGPQPIIPPNATQAQIGELVRAHTENLRQFNEYTSIHAALHKQLLNAVEETYVRALKQPHIGYVRRSVREILAHLFANYGNIFPQDLVQNTTEMSKPWDPSTPFESLIAQIEECVEYADDGHQPITTAQTLNTAFTLVMNSGLYFDACKEWLARPAHERTWVNFKEHFLQAQSHLQRIQATGHNNAIGNFGHSANTVINADSLSQLIRNAVVEVAAPLMLQQQPSQVSSAMSTTSELTDHHAALAATNASLTEQLQLALTELQKLKTTVSNLSRARQPTTSNKQPTGYCWSHGVTYNPTPHTSENCQKPRDGHQREATDTNRKGGSDYDRYKK